MSCYYVAADQPRYIRKRHGDECPESAWFPPLAWVDCAGCVPCPALHCIVGWRGERGDCQTHAETVCPACLAKTREHLAEIVRLSGLPLVAEALTKGADSEASDLLGPAANPKAWRQRGDYGHRFEPDSRVGEQHPLWVLGWFDMIVTEHQGHSRTQRITVTSAANYLDRNLHFLAADIEFDFPDMANTIADCRTHLEQVLRDGEQRETGAPCMTCRIPLELVRGEHEDRWRCPRCKEQSTEDQYRFALRLDFIENAAALNVDDMAVRIGVASSTIRKWANVVRTQEPGEEPVEHPALLAQSGIVNGRKVYLVADAELIRDNGGDQRRSLARRAIVVLDTTG